MFSTQRCWQHVCLAHADALGKRSPLRKRTRACRGVLRCSVEHARVSPREESLHVGETGAGRVAVRFVHRGDRRALALRSQTNRDLQNGKSPIVQIIVVRTSMNALIGGDMGHFQ
eukprot:6793194-Prymnesium_polylepis.1